MNLLHEIHGLSECCVPGDYLFAQFCKTNDNVLKKNRVRFSNQKVNCRDKTKLCDLILNYTQEYILLPSHYYERAADHFGLRVLNVRFTGGCNIFVSTASLHLT